MSKTAELRADGGFSPAPPADWRDRDYPDPGRFPARFAVGGGDAETVVLEVYRGVVEGNREFFALDEALASLVNGN